MLPNEIIEILNQLSGMIACIDGQSNFIYCNEVCVKKCGYESQEAAIGSRVENMPCAVSEYSDVLIAQNNHVLNTHLRMRKFDVHPYAKNEVLSMMMDKSILKYGDNQSCVLLHGNIVSRTELLNIGMALARSDKLYRPNNNISQRSYTIDKQFSEIKLSMRELECLFYLVRGKSNADISAILGLSKRTVESYVDNIKLKTHCVTKSDLIERAIQTNFIDFIPESLLMSNKRHISIVLN